MEEENIFQPGTDISELGEAVKKIKSEIGKIIVGQEELIELLIACLLSDGHVLIEGVPGIAKTLSAKLLSRTINTKFSRIQFTPDLMPSDVIGTSIYNSREAKFEFKKGPIFSNVVLIDEINRAPAKTQAALFEVMEERQITFDGITYPMETPFLILSTQNPIDQEGTYRLPEAQLDRFLFKVEVDYPQLDEETKIISEFHHRNNRNDLNEVKAVLTPEQLLHFREKVFAVKAEEKLINYIAQIVYNTRNNPMLYLGASPRASLSILTSAKAIAAMRGRDFITPEDVKFVTKPVLRHRMMLTPEKEMEGTTTDEVISQIVESVEIPR